MSVQTPEFGMEIVGYGHVVPSHLATNDEIQRQIDPTALPGDEDWIKDMTGIVLRPHADRELGETTTSLAIEAGRRAILYAYGELGVDNTRTLLVATSTPDFQVPATANAVQEVLGLRRCLSTDLSAACSGFVHGVVLAQGMMSTLRDREEVLVVGADTVTTITDPADRATAPIFADGAGAMLLRRVNGSDKGVLGMAWDNQGEHRDLFASEHAGCIKMNGPRLFRAISRLYPTLIEAALEDAGMAVGDIDILVPHQSNGRFIDDIPKKTGIPAEKIIKTIGRMGNSSAATVPEAFSIAMQDGRIKQGSVVMLLGVAVGVGGSCVIMRV